MKKILGVLLAINFILPAFAYDDFVVSVGDTIAQIKNKTPNIIDVEVVTTLLNERNTIVVTSKKEGRGEFCIILENGQISDFVVTIDDVESKIKTNKNYEIFTIDSVSKIETTDELDFELDLPPGVEWNK